MSKSICTHTQNSVIFSITEWAPGTAAWTLKPERLLGLRHVLPLGGSAEAT